MTVDSTIPRRGSLIRDRHRHLVAQVGWFNRLRFAAVVGMAVAIFGAHQIAGILDEAFALYALCATTLAVNFAYIAWSSRLRDCRRVSVRRHVVLQIAIDLVILTLVLHYSGGVTNPLVLFYTFHTFIASLLLSVRFAVCVAAVSVMLIAALGFGEHFGVFDHYPMRVGLLRDGGVAALAAWIATLVLVLGVMVYFVSTILARLRASEEELVGLTQQLALSEKLASIGTLAAGVSHEINNPVGVIANKTEILRYRITDGDPAQILLQEIDTIARHVGRIRAITTGLFAFARETPFELQDVDAVELVGEAVELVRVPFESSEIALVVRPTSGRPSIVGSRNHLLQVLVNVLLNARDASARGSRVEVSIAANGERVRVHVRDYGEGIAQENLGKIFDPFFTTKDVDRGTGLGLALSHGLVERHNGQIDVESEVGVGSMFTITLPRA